MQASSWKNYVEDWFTNFVIHTADSLPVSWNGSVPHSNWSNGRKDWKVFSICVLGITVDKVTNKTWIGFTFKSTIGSNRIIPGLYVTIMIDYV